MYVGSRGFDCSACWQLPRHQTTDERGRTTEDYRLDQDERDEQVEQSINMRHRRHNL